MTEIEAQLQANEKNFLAWVKEKNIHVFDKLSDVVPLKIEMKKGQKCTYINNYGVYFKGYTIMGFCYPESYGGCVFLNKSSYWFPVCVENIKLESENNILHNGKDY